MDVAERCAVAVDATAQSPLQKQPVPPTSADSVSGDKNVQMSSTVGPEVPATAPYFSPLSQDSRLCVHKERKKKKEREKEEDRRAHYCGCRRRPAEDREFGSEVESKTLRVGPATAARSEGSDLFAADAAATTAVVVVPLAAKRLSTAAAEAAGC